MYLFLFSIQKGCDFLSKKRNYRRFLIVLLVADIFAAGVLGFRHLQNSIPNTVYIHAGQEEELSRALDSPLLTYPDTIDVSDRGSYRISCSLFGILPIKEVQVQTMEEKSVAVCGVPVGLYMETEGVLVVDTGEILQKDGISCRACRKYCQSRGLYSGGQRHAYIRKKRTDSADS